MKRTTLKRRKPLNQISPKQRAKNALWNKIADGRAEEECFVCQWCRHIGQRLSASLPAYLDGHHIVKRRYNIHTKENCYIVHRFGCHGEIEDNNVDVRVYLNKEAWESRAK